MKRKKNHDDDGSFGPRGEREREREREDGGLKKINKWGAGTRVGRRMPAAHRCRIRIAPFAARLDVFERDLPGMMRKHIQLIVQKCKMLCARCETREELPKIKMTLFFGSSRYN